jgi:hypothetical protein
MSGESSKLWRCPACNRVLIEKSVDYVRQRHAALLSRARCGAVDFVREAMWPAYLASMKRCRCGSRSTLKPLPPAALWGQLDLHTDAVVLQ